MADFDARLPIRIGDEDANELIIAQDGVAEVNTGFEMYGTDGTLNRLLLTDTSGHLQVDVLTGGGGPEDTDDDSVAAGQSASLGIGLTYGYNGATWERVTTDGSGSLDTNITLALPAGANNIGKVQPTDGTNDLDFVVIDSAYGATPVATPIAGKYEATPTAYTDGDATPLLVDANGRLQVDVISGGGTNTQETDDDSIAAGTLQDSVVNLNYGYNGATWERITTDGSGSADVNVTLALPAGANSIGTVGLDAGTNNIGDIGTIVDLQSTEASTIPTLGLVPHAEDPSGNSQPLQVNAAGELLVSNDGSGLILTDHASANLVKDTLTTVNSYSPGAATDIIRSVSVSGSGRYKAELFFGTTASEAVIDVKFNSTASPNVTFELEGELAIAAAQTILVKMTNLENAASPASDFDGYVTFYYTD